MATLMMAGAPSFGVTSHIIQEKSIFFRSSLFSHSLFPCILDFLLAQIPVSPLPKKGAIGTKVKLNRKGKGNILHII